MPSGRSSHACYCGFFPRIGIDGIPVFLVGLSLRRAVHDLRATETIKYQRKGWGQSPKPFRWYFVFLLVQQQYSFKGVEGVKPPLGKAPKPPMLQNL
jgi:hypothetical protein